MNKKQEFVLGFIFNKDLTKILLIKKNRGPKGLNSMKNRINGIGGHMEKNESFYDSIQRECLEETGLDIEDWIYFCSLDTKIGKIYCFYIVTDEVYNYKQIEDEKLKIYDLSDFTILNSYKSFDRMYNLDYLIPMAINHYKKLDNTKLFEIKEIYK